MRLRRTPVGAVVGAAALAVALGGCHVPGFGTFAKQTVVVAFKPGTPQSVHREVLRACGHLPAVRAEPIGPGQLYSYLLYNVRFQVNEASDAQLAALYRCLARQPDVVGTSLESPGGG